jgi:hypothetical protein
MQASRLAQWPCQYIGRSKMCYGKQQLQVFIAFRLDHN